MCFSTGAGSGSADLQAQRPVGNGLQNSLSSSEGIPALLQKILAVVK
jgi:hypothetical protein